MIADNLKLRPALNLQLFGEEPTETPEAPVEPAEPQPQAAQEPEVPSYESLTDFLKQYEVDEVPVIPQEPSEEVIPTETPPEGQTVEEQMILGKFKTQDDLVNAYKEAERRISEYGQDGSKARQELEQLRGQVSQLQRFLTQQRYQQSQVQPSPEEIQKKNQEWLDKFYENPHEALNEVVNQRVREVVGPIQRDYQYQQHQRRFQQQVEEARQKYPDFDDLQPVMHQIVQEQGQYITSLPNAVEVVYSMARLKNPQQSPQVQQTPESVLQNEEFRKQVLQDESIRKEILAQYAQEVKNRQTAPVMGNQHGEPASTPPQEITTTKDAKKASLSYFQRLAGRGTQ